MKGVLLVTIGFPPNIGGIETHFSDLVEGLVKRKWKVFVLTYQPLTAKMTAAYFEIVSGAEIHRLPILKGLFYKLVKSPLLEFIYLTPGLFVWLPVVLAVKGNSIQVIHSHGLIAGFVSVFWGKIFRKRVITTTHSMYEFPETGLYTALSKWIFTSSDSVLCLSMQSVNEILKLGVPKSKVVRFVYWIDENRFKKVKNAKQILHLDDRFTVLFVGRLVPEKGIDILLKSLQSWPKGTRLIIAGTGPLESKVKKIMNENSDQLMYVGSLSQNELSLYYSAANMLIVPSVHEEGFGRVIIESLFCGTPVIGANRGAIPEALDQTVGELIQVTEKNISSTIKKYMRNRALLSKKSARCRKYAEQRFSSDNIESILSTYLDA